LEGSIPIFQSTEADLGALCRPFGQVGRIHIVTDQTARARGFALVEMYNDTTPRFSVKRGMEPDFQGDA